MTGGPRERSYQDLVEDTRSLVREIDAAELSEHFEDVVLVDIREAEEYTQGAIPGALFIPRGTLESDITARVPQRGTDIVLYCSVGTRSILAAQSLQLLGYENVSSLAGGFDEWKTEQRPWEVPDALGSEQRARYSRHLLLAEIGEEGQRRLLRSRVLLVGAGGLGSPAALYLAAAGVGTLGLVDSDIVDATNLQRQVLHNTFRLGRAKVDSARETLTALNPDVTIVTYETRLAASNVLDIMTGFDVVVDGADNFPTRYLVNDASLHIGAPVVHGSIFRFEGQASVFSPYQGPCYRCLYRRPPPPQLAPSCAEAGVLGVLPGVIGSIQALETIKLLLGIGDPLVGRLMLYDALEQEFRTVKLRRDPDCPACGDRDRPPEIIEYDQYCVPAGTTVR
jgi:molybdopterin/thiamine biosynthesis adenylyltransferase/rhodanese-related sulfurtransferase